MEEYLDIYNLKGEFLNYAKPKSEVHAKGLWHKTFHCWIIYRISTKNGFEDYIVLQKRAANKKNFPNKFDITAAGHYTAGEGIEGGLREIKEELGIDVEVNQLIPLGLRVCADETGADFKNCEFQEVFFLIDNRPLISYHLQVEEVQGIVAVPIDACIDLFMDKVKSICGKGYQLNSIFQLEPTTYTIRKADFITTIDNYYLKICLLGKRALIGEELLFI